MFNNIEKKNLMNNDTKYIKEMIERLASEQAWNHNFKLQDGLQTRPGNFSSPAKNSNKLERLCPALDVIGLKNKSVIDMGCNEGFFSIELAKRGASVRGYDADAKRIEKARFIQRLVVDDLNIDFECLNILQESSKIERADVALCLGFLHRVPDPISVVKTMSELADCVVFEWKAHYASGQHPTLAAFTTQSINETDFYGTEYWLLSVDALRAICKRYGFDHAYLMPNPSGRREILIASKSPLIGLNIQNERLRLITNAYNLLKASVKMAMAALVPFKKA